MKVSNIKAIITEKDLNNILNDVLINYAKVPELKITNIIINKYIIISGVYNTKVKIPFEAQISVIEVINNKVTLVLQSVSIKRISINKSIKKYIMQKVIKEFNEIGISVINDVVKIDLDKICKVIQIVSFNLIGINLIPGGLDAEFSDFNFFSEELEKKETNEIVTEKEIFVENERIINKCLDSSYCNKEHGAISYSAFRRKIKGKFPNKFSKTQEFILLMPDIFSLLLRLYKDSRVKKDIKITISIALGYLLCPIDILPDWIPFIGTFDDITVTLFILNKIFCNIPEEVIMENWEGEKNIVELVKKYVEYLSKIMGIKKINSILGFCSKVMEKGYNFFVE